MHKNDDERVHKQQRQHHHENDNPTSSVPRYWRTDTEEASIRHRDYQASVEKQI